VVPAAPLLTVSLVMSALSGAGASGQLSMDKMVLVRYLSTVLVVWELFPIIKVGYLLRPSKVYTHKSKQFSHIFGSHTSTIALLPRNMCSFTINKIYKRNQKPQILLTRISGRYAPLILAPAEGSSLEPYTLDYLIIYLIILFF
jgi:hypothetical protein